MSATDTPFERAADPYRVGRGRDWLSEGAGRGYVYATGHGEGGPASKRVIVGFGLVAAYVVFVVFAWRDVEEYVIPADEVARIDRQRRQHRAEWLARHARAEAPA